MVVCVDLQREEPPRPCVLGRRGSELFGEANEALLGVRHVFHTPTDQCSLSFGGHLLPRRRHEFHGSLVIRLGQGRCQLVALDSVTSVLGDCAHGCMCGVAKPI